MENYSEVEREEMVALFDEARRILKRPAVGLEGELIQGGISGVEKWARAVSVNGNASKVGYIKDYVLELRQKRRFLSISDEERDNAVEKYFSMNNHSQ